MARQRPRTSADRRRRTFGQNLLADAEVVRQAVDRLDLGPDDLVVEVGPGRGALTLPLVATGAAVVAVERDGAMADDLRGRLAAAGHDQARGSAPTSAGSAGPPDRSASSATCRST